MMQLPIGKESNFKGVIDILRDRAIYFDGACGEVLRYDEVPQEYRTQHKETHHELVEYLVRKNLLWVNFGKKTYKSITSKFFVLLRQYIY